MIRLQLVPRADQGFEECGSCAHNGSGTCDFCEDGDQWEEADMSAVVREQELLAA